MDSVSIEWIEPHIGLVRCHPNGGSWENEAEYDIGCVVHVKGRTGEIKLANGRFKLHHGSLLLENLKQDGRVDDIYWVRINRGKRRVVRMNVNRPGH